MSSVVSIGLQRGAQRAVVLSFGGEAPKELPQQRMGVIGSRNSQAATPLESTGVSCGKRHSCSNECNLEQGHGGPHYC